MPPFASFKKAMVPMASLALLVLSHVAYGQCTTMRTYSGANFGGGSFIVQAGFAENEMAAASFTIAASEFPIKINLIEMIFAQSAATVTTTTEWSVFVYEGDPRTGTLLYEYSSDGLVLPHLVMGPGTNGTNIQFSIDPNDPDQMYVYNNGQSNTFTVGYRIDRHNNPPANPCLQSPPTNSNAFPTTDADGNLSAPTNNWLFAIDCGIFGAPPGWSRFSELPSFFRPSGDWNIRVTYESLNAVAITDHPDNVNTTIGQPAIFQVAAVGPGQLQYQWHKGTEPLQNGNGIFGAMTDTLFIFPTVASHAGAYRCVVSSPCGTVSSNEATLSFGPQTRTITGNVSLGDWLASPNGQIVQIQVREVGSQTSQQTQNVVLNASGNFSFDLAGTLQANAYDFTAKGTHWLRKLRGNVSIGATGATGVDFSLVNGDVDGDNEVGIGDYSILSASFGLSLGDPGYDPMADLNGDESVDIGDYAILSARFGAFGDE